MITAIFTSETTTTLTIETSEAVNLQKMGQQAPVEKLEPGKRSVDVGAGVFKLESNGPVVVTTSGRNVFVAYTTNDKDGQFPDPPGVRVSGLNAYFVNGKSVTV